ncbi:sugar ABC transporter permease [Clostridia bacterium]|nr:sugar ABC transporter permease [Clostridia bacterium]
MIGDEGMKMSGLKLKNVIQRSEFAVIAITIILFVVLATGSDIFFNVNNLNSLQTSIAPSALVAFGMMLLLILGVFDLSVGATMALVGISVSTLLASGVSVPLAVLGGFGIGVLVGFVNGILVGVVGINPLIATIGIKFMVQGLAYMRMSNLYQVHPDFPASFTILGTGKLFGIYYQFLFMIVILIILSIFLKNNGIGRRLYYIGGNRNASRLMGFNSKRMIIIIYIVIGLLAAAAAIFSIARYGNANRYLGSGIEMTAIISCVLGGASLSGGKGTAMGALFGVIFMSLMTNFFNLFEVSSTWQDVVVGAILIIVVAADGYLTLKKNKELGKI